VISRLAALQASYYKHETNNEFKSNVASYPPKVERATELNPGSEKKIEPLRSGSEKSPGTITTSLLRTGGLDWKEINPDIFG
jgi:hypothetical protein